ncbi:MAG: ABC transporter permease [Acidimicrobiia bacterium]
MWKATVRGLFARKVRLTLTALAIVLGVAFVSGTYVLTDTLKQSFGQIFAQTAVNVDLVVRSQAPFDNSGDDDGLTTRARMPDAVVAQVRRVPGVAVAEGSLQGYAQFVQKDGQTAIGSGGAPSLGFSWSSPDGAVGPLRILDDGESRPPERDGEVVMDQGTAERNGFAVGDRVKVLSQGPAESFRIVGLFGLGDQFDLGAVSAAAFDPATAQRVVAAPGLVDQVIVKAEPGAVVSSLRAALARQLGPGYDVTSADQVAAEIQQPVDEFLNTLNDALLGFAGIGLFVGAFIIFNTFTILVSQRTRELGLFRALGASRRQVVGSVIIEAAVVGLLAAVVGFGAGIALAELLLRLLPRFGLTVPDTDLVVISRTLIACAVVGIGVTVAAALPPAVRASRTAPIAAIADLQPTGGAPLVRRSILGALVLLVGAGIIAFALLGSLTTEYSVATAFTGGFVLFLGLVVLGPLLARRMSAIVGRPLPTMLGVTGTLARGNAMRNPRRTSATAAALVVGLGLVSLVAIFADSVKTSVRSSLESSVRADYIIAAPQFAGFSPEAAEQAAEVPGIKALVPLRFGDARIDVDNETITGANANGIDTVFNLEYVEGDSEGLAEGGTILSKQAADFYDARVGDRLIVSFPRIGPQELPIVGIYENRRVTGAFPVDVVVALDTFEQGFGGTQQDTLVYVKAQPGQLAAVGSGLERVLAGPFPNVSIDTVEEYREERERTIDQFLNVFFALLFLSEVIAVLGIVNTLMLSVYERTRELGLLRVVGMTRRQVRRMIRGESVVIAVIGSIIGLFVGLLWGWAVVTALSGQFVDEFSVPTTQLAVFVVVFAVAGVIAAIIPAWRASQLGVLEAIANE